MGVANYTVDVLFIVDIVVRLRTSAATRSVDIDDGSDVKSYSRRWLGLHLMAAYPAGLAPGGEGGERIVLALKLARLPHLVPVLAELQRELRLWGYIWLKIGLLLGLVCHVLSCTWRLAMRA